MQIPDIVNKKNREDKILSSTIVTINNKKNELVHVKSQTSCSKSKEEKKKVHLYSSRKTQGTKKGSDFEAASPVVKHLFESQRSLQLQRHIHG